MGQEEAVGMAESFHAARGDAATHML